MTEGRSPFDTASAEVKELTAVKLPFDFFKLQNEFVRRNLEDVFAVGAKNSKAILSLAEEASAPLTKQAKAVIDTVHKAA